MVLVVLVVVVVVVVAQLHGLHVPILQLFSFMNDSWQMYALI